MSKPKLDTNSIIITGTDRGLGRYLRAKLIYKYNIIGSSKWKAGENDLSYLNFNEQDSIKNYIDTVFKNNSPAYLIQNIGLCVSDHPFNFTIDDINKVYKINFTSAFWLIKLYLEKTSFKGKVIVISSVASTPVDFSGTLGVYGGAKFALERALDDVKKQTGSSIYIVNPPPLKPGRGLSPQRVYHCRPQKYKLKMEGALPFESPLIVLNQIKSILSKKIIS